MALIRSFSKCLSRNSATLIERRRAVRNSLLSSTPHEASARVMSFKAMGGAYISVRTIKSM